MNEVLRITLYVVLGIYAVSFAGIPWIIYEARRAPLYPDTTDE